MATRYPTTAACDKTRKSAGDNRVFPRGEETADELIELVNGIGSDFYRQ
jgi:hypothetical protein